MGFILIFWTYICGKYFLNGSFLEKCGKIWKNSRFSGRLRPDWGNTARPDTAGLGSKGLIGPVLYVQKECVTLLILGAKGHTFACFCNTGIDHQKPAPRHVTC